MDCRDAKGWPPLLYAHFVDHQDCVLALMKAKPAQVREVEVERWRGGGGEAWAKGGEGEEGEVEGGEVGGGLGKRRGRGKGGLGERRGRGGGEWGRVKGKGKVEGRGRGKEGRGGEGEELEEGGRKGRVEGGEGGVCIVQLNLNLKP